MVETSWDNPGNETNKSFTVIQVGSTLHFYDGNTKPLSDGKKPFTVDLDSFKVPSQSTASFEKIDSSTGIGVLFVVSKAIEPIFIEYNSATDSITVQPISIKVRDFEGVEDNLEVDENPSVLSDAHRYNLRNQGWLSPSTGQPNPIAQYKNKNGSYPANNQQWWVAKTGNDYRLDDVADVYFGQTQAPKGHYLVNPFKIDRSSVSDVSGLPVVTEASRPSAVQFYSGRVFYGFNNRIFYSQVLTDLSKAGKCYQDADPTSEEISDPIPTDGGVIEIPEMSSPLSAKVLNKSLLVYAQSGVWQISGPDGESFKSTDFFVRSVSDSSPQGPGTVVKTESTVYWWTDSGIFRIGQDQVSGALFDEEITNTSIRSLISEVETKDKQDVKGKYDSRTKRIFWLYKSSDNRSPERYKYNKIIILDTILNAFYIWDIKFKEENSPYVGGIVLTSATNFATIVTDIVDSSNNPIVDSNSNNIIADKVFPDFERTNIKFLTIVPNSVTNANSFVFSEERDQNFKEWGTNTYRSFIDTGYFMQGDIARTKRAPYMYVYSKRSETKWILNEDGDGLIPDIPSSLKVRAFWDWSDSDNSNLRTAAQEVYKRDKVYTPDTLEAQDFDDGMPVVSSRIRLKGRGQALQLRFESEEDANFHLLGWSVVSEINNNV